MNETIQTPAGNIVRLENVSFTSDGFEILRNVTLSLEAAKSTVIMGHSGSGKSTLLKIAAGLLLPSTGRVLIGERDVSRMTSRELLVHRKDRGFVFQDAALWANTSIYRNLALPLEVHHVRFPKAEVDARVKRTAERFGLLGELELRPAQLSMGEQKIVSFLRALITEPSVLFLDEPTTSVDHASAEKMIAMIREFKAGGGVYSGGHPRREARFAHRGQSRARERRLDPGRRTVRKGGQEPRPGRRRDSLGSAEPGRDLRSGHT